MVNDRLQQGVHAVWFFDINVKMDEINQVIGYLEVVMELCYSNILYRYKLLIV